jgi:hypothetical protein
MRTLSRLIVTIGIAVAAVTGTASPSFAAVNPVALTLSTNQGPNTGGNTITATIPFGGVVQFFPGVDVEFQAAASGTSACTPTYASPVTPTSATGGVLDVQFVMVISANRIAINLPNFGSAPLTAKYNVCVYSAGNSTGQLLAQTTAGGVFTIGMRVNLGNVWPIAGPSLGGTAITVYGNNFPTTATTPPAAPALTATLGGLPLLNITLVSPNNFTAVTPARSASTTPVPLIVTTASGSTVLAKAFTYSNGITVMPNTAPNTRMGSTPVDVQGIGFGGLNFMFNSSPDDKNAHVYLVKGLYDPANNNGAKRNGELVECGNVNVVSDNELVCSMNLQASLTAGGTSAMPTRTISANTVTDFSLTNINPPLSPSDQGMRLSGSGIAPGTTIATVGANGTTATVSIATNATAQGVTLAMGIGNVVAIITPPPNQPTPQPVPPLTAINPPLSQADNGRVVTGTGIPPGTTIMGINQDGTSANLSSQPTSSATGQSGTITISDPVPVPVGTYTLTVVSNGNVNAFPADQSYTQSVICSGATFTIADF